MAAENKPVKVFKARGVSASVFQNKGKKDDREYTYYKVNVQRTYKEGDEFKTTHTFGENDVPLAINVLQKAWDFVLNKNGS